MKSVKIKFFNKITKHIHITQPTEKKRNRIYIKCTTRIELLHKNFVKKKKKKKYLQLFITYCQRLRIQNFENLHTGRCVVLGYKLRERETVSFKHFNITFQFN